MKKTSCIFLLTLSVITAKAQQMKTSTQGFHFAGGLNIALPLGDFSDTYSVGMGIELQPEYNVSAVASIYGSAGYTYFFTKDIGVLNIDNLGLVPILAGAKVYFSPRFFIGAKAGMGILTGGETGSGFDYQPQFGFNNKNFYVNFSYNGLSKNSITLSSFFLSCLYKFK